MIVFESINENEEIRNNMFNDELKAVDIISGLSDDDSNSIIKSANGVGFDGNGNIVDQSGKVVMSPDELRSNIRDYYTSLDGSGELNPLDYEAVEIDGVSYTINEKGEAVDAEGKVFKTIDEVKAALIESGAGDEPKDIAAVMALANEGLGINFNDAEGNPIDFDLNTVDGMQARDKFLIDSVSANMATEAVDAIFKNDPDFESLYHYKKANGNATGWSPAIDYSKVELLAANADGAEDQYRDVIIKAEIARGSTPDRAKQFAQYLIDDGKGEETAKESLTALNTLSAASTEADRVATQQAQDAEALRIDTHWKGVSDSINSGTVNGIKIPAFIAIPQEDGTVRNVPRNTLYDYMSKPVKDGLSAHQLHKQSLTSDDQIVDALMAMTKKNNTSVINANVKDKQVKFIRKAITNNRSGSNVKLVNGKAPNESVVL